MKNRLKKGKLLLAFGADPDLQDSNGRTPLSHAFDGGDLKIMEFLVSCSDLNLPDGEGLTPLHFVLENGEEPLAPKSFMKLMEAGADINARTEYDQETPLEVAALHTTLHGTFYLEALMNAGCDLNAKTRAGESILHVVARDSETPNIAADMMEKLIHAGLDVDSMSPYQTPLMNSIEAFNPLVAQLLLQANCSCKLKKFSYDSQVAGFMAESTYRNSQDCATFLFGDCLSSPEDQDLQKYYYNLSLTEEALEDGESIGLSPPPTSLLRLCRLAVRASLPKGLTFLTAVEKLPLPRILRDFVTLQGKGVLNLRLP